MLAVFVHRDQCVCCFGHSLFEDTFCFSVIKLVATPFVSNMSSKFAQDEFHGEQYQCVRAR